MHRGEGYVERVGASRLSHSFNKKEKREKEKKKVDWVLNYKLVYRERINREENQPGQIIDERKDFSKFMLSRARLDGEASSVQREYCCLGMPVDIGPVMGRVYVG